MEFAHSFRSLVDERLRRYLNDKTQEIMKTASPSVELVQAVESLTMRGGKRLRPVLLAAAYRALRPDAPLEKAVDAGAALELLQSYLLIHDDFMDQDEERRGGKTAHVMLREAHGGNAHQGHSLAILAGDLACAYAWELMLVAPFAHTRRSEALRAFLRAQKEVYLGQHLDIVGDPDTSRMHDLKTGSYTVRLPLQLGSLLANASDDEANALEAFGAPLGEAFQLRDDLLGTFGDPRKTGKPAGNDLRSGKRTSLITEAETSLDGGDRSSLARVFGNTDASEEAIATVAEMLVDRGVRARVEERLQILLERSREALGEAPIADEGRALLDELANLFVMRTT